MSDHYHYEYAEARHDHRGEYASDDHDHRYDYAEKHHLHYDLAGDAERAHRRITGLQDEVGELRAELAAALGRIRQLEEQTPEARQAEYEADIALADAREGEPYTGRCCRRAAYDDSIGWWCPEHGDLS